MHAQEAPPLLIDLEAERGLVGVMLEDVQPDELDPAAFSSDGVRLLYLTTLAAMNAGLLYTPSSHGNAPECYRVRKANAEIIAHEVDRLGIWPNADGVRWELAACLDSATLPWFVDWYRARIRDAFLRRRMVERAREIARMAKAPGPLDMTEVARCMTV